MLALPPPCSQSENQTDVNVQPMSMSMSNQNPLALSQRDIASVLIIRRFPAFTIFSLTDGPNAMVMMVRIQSALPI